MRIWDLAPHCLCRQHLLGEHRELHAVWSILTQNKTGYRRHPETRRWEGKLKALYLRHQQIVAEMERRGFRHQTNLDAALATGSAHQDQFLNTVPQQLKALKNKPCDCLHGD